MKRAVIPALRISPALLPPALLIPESFAFPDPCAAAFFFGVGDASYTTYTKGPFVVGGLFESERRDLARSICRCLRPSPTSSGRSGLRNGRIGNGKLCPIPEIRVL